MFLKRLFKWITCPTVSNPKRPARPAICVYSCAYNIRFSLPSNFFTSVKIVVFTGMLIPIAKVSVQKRILMYPLEKSNSTISLKTGIVPA